MTMVLQTRLDEAGFTRLEERDAWTKKGQVEKGGKYYYNRNRWGGGGGGGGGQLLMVTVVPRSTLVAFTVGELYQPGGEFKVSRMTET